MQTKSRATTTTEERVTTGPELHAGISRRDAATATTVLSNTTRLTKPDGLTETRTDGTTETIETTTTTQEAQIITEDTGTTTTTEGGALPDNQTAHALTTWTVIENSAVGVLSPTTPLKANATRAQERNCWQKNIGQTATRQDIQTTDTPVGALDLTDADH